MSARRLLPFVLVTVMACSDPAEPVTDDQPDGTDSISVLLSDPSIPPTPAPGLGAVSAFVTDVAYVALEPGSVPGGEVVTVLNLQTGESRQGLVIDGGFDPIAIPAMSGDSINVKITAGGVVLFAATKAVDDKKKPVVVRTEPPRRKIDVPLNFTLVIVVSEPLRPPTVDGSTILLQTGGAPVGVNIRLSDDGLRIFMTPDQPLTPATEYEIIVTTGVQDLQGEAPDSAFTSTFTTVTQVGFSFAQVGTGLRHSCGILTNGRAVCWGSNSWGQLGAEDITDPSKPGRTVIGDLSFVVIDGGEDHTCGLSDQGVIYCWGFNALGQLGKPGPIARAEPQPVAGVTRFVSLSVGDHDHACALARDGSVWCWGSNEHGQLGRAAVGEQCSSGSLVTDCSRVPVRVEIPAAVAVSVRRRHSCAVTQDGAVWCWGDNSYGQVGNATDLGPTLPTAVALNATMVAVAAGEIHTCALDDAGLPYCWGANEVGQLGVGRLDAADFIGAPSPVSTAFRFQKIQAGASNTCGVATGGTNKGYCWGNNIFSQSGTGDLFEDVVPTEVLGGHSWIDIAPSWIISCGVTTQFEMWCWGLNDFDQLGSAGSASEPRKVEGQ